MSVMGIFRQLLRGRIPANQMQCSFVLAPKFDRCDFAQLVEGRLTVPLGIWTNLQQSDLPLLYPSNLPYPADIWVDLLAMNRDKREQPIGRQ